ncbi:MAG: 4Fe-4S dicluster domain-containing protein [Methanobacteriota archaeon]
MYAFTLEIKNMNLLLNRVLKEYQVFGPTKPSFDSTFDEITSLSQLHLEYISTVLPPKKLFHPPQETLFSFTRKNSQFTIQEEPQEKKRLLLGIHPCDVHALLKLDKFFSGDFNDSYYQNRRKNTVVVALNCVEPGEYAFCASMGTGPFLKEGYDLLLTEIGTKYLIEVGSDIGSKILEGVKLEKATEADLHEKERRFKLTEKKFKKSINTTWLPRLAQTNLDNEVWTSLGERGGVADSFPCLSCGSCTFVCPTCYCYDIYDTVDLSFKKGMRKRELDSCQLLEYAEVALGGNFRSDRKNRIRHWMMCKFGAAAGGINSSCVGCGRCIRVCPSKIDITEVAKVIREASTW